MKKFILPLIVALTLCGCGENPSSSSVFSESSTISVVSNTTQETTKEEKKFKTVEYQNPLKFYKQDGSEYDVTVADPDILKAEDGYWYMYCTNTYCEMGTKGVAYDRGPIFQSKDLINWKWIGSVFDGHPDALSWHDKDAGVWAPSIIKVGENYNYYYSLSLWGDSNPGIGVATSPTPYGPWTHYGKLLDSVTSGVSNSIDPQAIYDGDSLYLVWGSFFGIGCVQLTDDGTEVFWGLDNLKEHVTYIIPDNSIDKQMDINANYEGSYIIKKDGKFYYFGSQGTCCSGRKSTYKVKVGVSDSLFGPYVGSDGLTLDNKGGSFGDLVIGPSDYVAGVGHNTIVKDYNDEYWIYYHGFNINGTQPDERIPFIDKLKWDDSTGMPYVEGRVASINKKLTGPTVIDF